MLLAARNIEETKSNLELNQADTAFKAYAEIILLFKSVKAAF